MHRYTLVFALCAALSASADAAEQTARTDAFEFTLDGKTFRGFIDTPADREPTALVVIVPGDGRTNVEAGIYRDLSWRLVKMGLACCLWDKSGCGKSDGTYDDQQTVQESAEESLAGIAELRRRGVAGSRAIGLWGISRGGWVAPLVMERDASIAFWISVSGVDGEDNNTYLLERNLLIQGRSEQVVRALIAEYRKGNRLFWQGGSYRAYVRATANLHRDEYYRKLHGEQYSREEYEKDQRASMKRYAFDDRTASIVLVPGFARVLKRVRCPVLAVFGERDSQVDWRRTAALYRKTIGVGRTADLTIRTFPECGHPLLKCSRCGVDYDDLKDFGYQPRDGYYDAIAEWLNQHGFGGSRD